MIVGFYLLINSFSGANQTVQERPISETLQLIDQGKFRCDGVRDTIEVLLKDGTQFVSKKRPI